MNTAVLINTHPSIFDTYAKWTDNVAQYPLTAEPFYLALGIADEAGELYVAMGLSKEHTLKEAGDVLWYAARYATRVLQVPFSEIVNEAGTVREPMLEAMGQHIGIICGVEKKRIRDGASWTQEKIAEKQSAAYVALINIVARVRYALHLDNLTLDDAVHANVAKLGARLDAGTIKGDGDNR